MLPKAKAKAEKLRNVILIQHGEPNFNSIIQTSCAASDFYCESYSYSYSLSFISYRNTFGSSAQICSERQAQICVCEINAQICSERQVFAPAKNVVPHVSCIQQVGN